MIKEGNFMHKYTLKQYNVSRLIQTGSAHRTITG